MGLGKTLQTITLLAYLASYKGIWGPHLIIVPTSVIINWETELKRFCPGFKVLCYYGSSKRRKELRTGWTKTNWYHVVITSYQLAVQDAFAFKRKKWYYLILGKFANGYRGFCSTRTTIANFMHLTWMIPPRRGTKYKKFQEPALAVLDQFQHATSAVTYWYPIAEFSHGALVPASFPDAVHLSITKGIFILVLESYE